MTDIINVQNVSKIYGQTAAVDNLSFQVKAGEFFGFLGPNGAGKTTTIRMLTGILSADQGSILINGQDVARRQKLHRTIGVLAESRGFYEWMTGREYLRFFADLYEIHNPEQEVKRILNLVGLEARQNSGIGTYSRGMKQRLGLARTLINNPKIIFLDEPTLGLDPSGQEDIHNLLQSLHGQGVTIFLSTHVLTEVAELCSTLAVINKGRLVAQGTMADLQKKTGQSDLKQIFHALTL